MKRMLARMCEGVNGPHDIKIMVTQELEVTVNQKSVRKYLERQMGRYLKSGRIENSDDWPDGLKRRIHSQGWRRYRDDVAVPMLTAESATRVT